MSRMIFAYSIFFFDYSIMIFGYSIMKLAITIIFPPTSLSQSHYIALPLLPKILPSSLFILNIIAIFAQINTKCAKQWNKVL